MVKSKIDIQIEDKPVFLGESVYKIDVGVRKLGKRSPDRYFVSIPGRLVKALDSFGIHYVHVILLIDKESMQKERAIANIGQR